MKPVDVFTFDGEGQWHKLCGIVMHKLGRRAVDITEDDLASFMNAYGGKASIVLDARGGQLRIEIVDEQHAAALLRSPEGSPS